jgi:hypothetical protein
MLTFKSTTDLKKLTDDHPALSVIVKHLSQLILAQPPYDPNRHGYLVLIEAADVGLHLRLPEIQRRLVDVPWEGATLEGGHFHAVYVSSNSFALSFLIPDAPWVTGHLRALLEDMVSS